MTNDVERAGLSDAEVDAELVRVCKPWALSSGTGHAAMFRAIFRAGLAHRAAAPGEAVAPNLVIDAQHDETGRMWRGRRCDLPHRYHEIGPTLAAPQPAAQESGKGGKRRVFAPGSTSGPGSEEWCATCGRHLIAHEGSHMGCPSAQTSAQHHRLGKT